MRKGVNPQKDILHKESSFFHQIVIPVYIPESKGYFKNALEILKISLSSLFKTCHKNTFFTIINNGSSNNVCSYLSELFANGSIHELIHTSNIGKVNAVYKGIIGHNFPLITVTDADVLFLKDWQEKSYAIFDEFPKAGFVTPTPSSRTIKYFTFDTIMKYWFSSKLLFMEPKNKLGLKRFAESIENPQFYNQAHLNNILTLKGNTINALVGGGHFVATYRGAIFNKVKYRYSKFKLGGKSVRDFFDVPVARKGYWRLATEDNYAYHMGNNIEPWMNEVLNSIPSQNNNIVIKPQLIEVRRNKLILFLKSYFFEKILTKRAIWKWFLRSKGLRNTDAKIY